MKKQITILPYDEDYDKILKLAEKKKWSNAQTAKEVLSWAFSKGVDEEDL